AVQLGFCEEIAAGAIQYLFALGAAFRSAFYTRHDVLLFAFYVLAAGGKDLSPSVTSSLFTRLRATIPFLGCTRLRRDGPRHYIVLSELAGEHLISDPPHSTRARVPAPHKPPAPHNLPITLSLIGNHARDLVRVGIAHQSRTAQFALPLLVLRGQDVAQVRVSPFYLSGGGLLEAFRRALM